MVKMRNLFNGNEWLWERAKFMDRRFQMQELYQKYLEDEDKQLTGPPTKESDPFFDPLDDVFIGTVSVFLQSLGYALDLEDHLTVSDYKGEDQGQLNLHITPCDANGKPLGDDFFVEDPSELLGKPYAFKVTIKSAEINKLRFSKGVRVQYTPFKKDTVCTPKVVGSSPVFNHSTVFSYDKVTPELIEWFETGCLSLLVYASQIDTKPDPKLANFTTSDLRPTEDDERTSARVTTKKLKAVNTSSAPLSLQGQHEAIIARYKRREAKVVKVLEDFDKMPASQQTYHGLRDSVRGILMAKQRFIAAARVASHYREDNKSSKACTIQ